MTPAAKQLQQSWDPEAFREAGLRLPGCKPKLQMFLERAAPPKNEPQPRVDLQGYESFVHTLSTYAQRLVGKYSMMSTTSRQMLRGLLLPVASHLAWLDSRRKTVPFFHASTSYPGRPSFQGGRIRWHACLNHVWLLVFSQEASPLQAVLYLCIYIGTHISAYCRNRITTSHAPASTTAFRILIICSGKKGGKSVSPSFSAPGFDIAAGQTGSLHSRDLSGR